MSDANPAPLLLADASEVRWHSLYRTAAIVALISVAMFLIQIAAYFLWPPPSTVAGHFALLESHPLIGLVSLDFFIIVDEILAIPLFLALYLSLRRVHESLMLIATALSLASILCFLIATPALSMLVLSQQYASTTTEVERKGLLAAGQALLSCWQGTPFQVGRNGGERCWIWALCAQGRRLPFYSFGCGHSSLVCDDRSGTFAAH